METENQSEVESLATWLENISGGISAQKAASELRRLHAKVQELEALLESVGAGGVSALRVTQGQKSGAAPHLATKSEERKPLTDEQLSEIAKEHTRSVGCYNCSEEAIPDRHNRIEDFARAIEKAHGIGYTNEN